MPAELEIDETKGRGFESLRARLPLHQFVDWVTACASTDPNSARFRHTSCMATTVRHRTIRGRCEPGPLQCIQPDGESRPHPCCRHLQPQPRDCGFDEDNDLQGAGHRLLANRDDCVHPERERQRVLHKSHKRALSCRWSVTMKGIVRGAVTIQATYSGDSNNLGSSGISKLTVT